MSFAAAQFVQATKSRRQNKTYTSYLVRESFRTAEGPRSRTVCNISALPPEVRDLIAQALSGKSCVALEEIQLSSALNYGGLAVLRDSWQRFGLQKLFAEVPQPRQRGLLQAMISCPARFASFYLPNPLPGPRCSDVARKFRAMLPFRGDFSKPLGT
jgi:hypothetical protein